MDYATVVDDAIKQFYSMGNDEAHSWLLQVQASPEAWHFVWQLLDPSKVINRNCILWYLSYKASNLFFIITSTFSHVMVL